MKTSTSSFARSIIVALVRTGSPHLALPHAGAAAEARAGRCRDSPDHLVVLSGEAAEGVERRLVEAGDEALTSRQTPVTFWPRGRSCASICPLTLWAQQERPDAVACGRSGATWRITSISPSWGTRPAARGACGGASPRPSAVRRSPGRAGRTPRNWRSEPGEGLQARGVRRLDGQEHRRGPLRPAWRSDARKSRAPEETRCRTGSASTRRPTETVRLMLPPQLGVRRRGAPRARAPRAGAWPPGRPPASRPWTSFQRWASVGTLAGPDVRRSARSGGGRRRRSRTRACSPSPWSRTGRAPRPSPGSRRSGGRRRPRVRVDLISSSGLYPAAGARRGVEDEHRADRLAQPAGDDRPSRPSGRRRARCPGRSAASGSRCRRSCRIGRARCRGRAPS